MTENKENQEKKLIEKRIQAQERINELESIIIENLMTEQDIHKLARKYLDEDEQEEYFKLMEFAYK